MKGYWAQPSLSRDFALLSAAILFVLFLVSSWITYTTYARHGERIAIEMTEESERIEHALTGEMESANYLLSALGKQIILDKDRDRDLVRLAQTLKSFDSKGSIYSIFSWIGPQEKVIVSSNRGILETPMDVSDRDYVKKAMAEPWKMHIGRPIEGRVSEHWIIPVAMGLTDYTGKFIGTIMASLDINTLSDHLSKLVKRQGIGFAIVSKTLIPLTQVSEDKDFVTNNFPIQKLQNVNFSSTPNGLITQRNLFWGAENYAYYRVSADYPYIILLGYDSRYGDETMRGMLWSRLLQILIIAVFLVLFLWIMRVRMIKPVLDMTAIATSVAKGNSYTPLPTGGPVEIEGLATQIRRISEYIEETQRIEDELRNKMFMLKRAKEKAEIDRRSKSEFLAYVCQEMRNPLNNVIGFAQVMRDQLYGPIENRKYRQYAADIYQTGNSLLTKLQDLLVLAKQESGYGAANEKPLEVSQAINKAAGSLAEKLRAEKYTLKVSAQEGLPKLIADDFRLQQVIANLMLYATKNVAAPNEISVEAKILNENRDSAALAIVIAGGKTSSYAPADLLALAAQPSYEPSYAVRNTQDPTANSADLDLEISRLLVALYQGALDIRKDDNGVAIAIVFGSSRLRFNEDQESLAV